MVFGLVHHTEVQERLREEIEEVLGDSEKITAEHLRDMKYTENVINEALRRYFNAGESNQIFLAAESNSCSSSVSNSVTLCDIIFILYI